MTVFSLAAALVLCAISSAQDTAATIEGRVLDPSGRAITGPPRLVQFGLELVFRLWKTIPSNEVPA
jgi:hypothetical protein